jgi:hypothetical protein
LPSKTRNRKKVPKITFYTSLDLKRIESFGRIGAFVAQKVVIIDPFTCYSPQSKKVSPHPFVRCGQSLTPSHPVSTHNQLGAVLLNVSKKITRSKEAKYHVVNSKEDFSKFQV